MSSTMGNKGKLTDSEYARLLARELAYRAKAEARQHRHKGLHKYNDNRMARRGKMFLHVPPEKRPEAWARFERYKLAHKDKLASLSGYALTRYIGCLAACAAKHTLHKPPSDMSRQSNMKRYRRGLQARLGLIEKHPFTLVKELNPDGSRRTRSNDGGLLASKVKAANDQRELPASGQTNLEGI